MAGSLANKEVNDAQAKLDKQDVALQQCAFSYEQAKDKGDPEKT